MKTPGTVSFACPECGAPARLRLADAAAWQCPACDHRLPAEPEAPGGAVPPCAVCGNAELYKKKDFPHGLGLFILTAACVASVFTYGWYEKWLTWAILIGSALFDGLLYLWVGDAVVCYRCLAHFRGLPESIVAPFELATNERYRQERIRRERLLEQQEGRKK
jgi:DNA-directed RNA polymerase subunit RPC12/RpoP